MIAAGGGPRPGEIGNVREALDALHDAQRWARAIEQLQILMADSGMGSGEFHDQALTEAIANLAGGVADEIKEACRVISAAQGRDIETEVEALSVIGEVLGRE